METWLPVNPGYWKVNVKLESKITDRITHLEIFKELVKLRQNIVFKNGDLRMYVLSDWVLAVTRYVGISLFSIYVLLIKLDLEEIYLHFSMRFVHLRI